MIDQAVKEYTESMGLNGLTITPRQPLALEIETLGRLTFLVSVDKLLLGLTRTVDATTPALCRLLSVCHFREGWGWPIQAQLRRGRYGFFVVMDESQVTAKSIDSAFFALTKALQKATLN